MSLPVIPEVSDPPQELNLKENLAYGLGVIRRRWFVLLPVFVLAVAAGCGLLVLRGPVYQASAILLVPSEPPSAGSITTGDPLQAIVGAMLPSGVQSQMKVLQSDSFLAEAMQRAGISDSAGGRTPTVNVEGMRDPGSAGTITITAEGRDPVSVTKLANAMVDLHLERMNSSSSTGFREAQELAQKEKQRTEQVLANAESTLLKFREAHPGLGVSTQREARAGEYAAVATRIPEIESNIAVAKSQIASLQLRLAKEPRDPVQVRENPRVVRLQNKVEDLNFQRMDLLREYKPTSRMVQDLDKQIALVQRELDRTPPEIQVRSHTPNPARTLLETRLEEQESTLEGLQHNYSAVMAEMQAQKSQMAQTGPAEIQLDRLTRTRDTAQAAFTSSSERLRDLELRTRAWKRMAGATVAATRATVPSRPSRSLKVKHLAMVGFLAAMLALGAVFLLELLDDHVTMPQRTERQLRVPILGYIPLIAGDVHPVLTELPTDSPIAESYRALRANLGFAALDGPLRSIVVTSAEAREGKSTIATNLAIALTLAGRGVILIDGDLRHPSLAELLHLPQSPGLTDVVTGNLDVDAALQETSIAGLSVLTGGSPSGNPADLLSTVAMTSLLDALRGKADILVIDTPPCRQFTDAQVLAAQVDGVLLVVDTHRAKKTEVRAARDLMDRAYARTVGMIFNRSHQTERPQGPMIDGGGRPGVGAGGTKELPADTTASPALTAAQCSHIPLKRGHSATYLALFLFSIVLWFRPYELIPALSNYKSMALWFALATLILFVPTQLALDGNITARLSEIKLILLLCLAALLSVPFAIDPGEAWKTFTDTFIKAVLIFVVIVNVVRTQGRLRGLIFISIAVGCLTSIMVLNAYQHGQYAADSQERVTGLAEGMLNNPNDLALHLVTMMPLALALLFISRMALAKLFWGALIVLMAAATVVSYSRGGFLGLAAAAAALAWKMRHHNPLRIAVIAAIAVSLLITLAPRDYTTRLASIFIPSLDPLGSRSARSEQLARSLAVTLGNPLFGVGMGNFHTVGIQEHETHNAFTQVASELGLPAAILYIWLLAVPLRRMRQIEHETRDKPAYRATYHLAVGLQVSLIAYMVSSFFASVAYNWYIYYLIGYAVCLYRIYTAVSNPRLTPQPSPAQGLRAATGRYRAPRPPVVAAQ